jgi:hypothetical protein
MSARGDGLERTENSGRRPEKLNLGASIQARLKNHAKDRGEDMRYVLARYVVERFLYRLSVSPYANGFVLRGATLFAIWNDTGTALFRPTRDLDMLATGEHSIEEYRTCLTKILGWEVPGDGVAFLPETLRMEERVAGRAYPGLSAVAIATVGTARPRLEIDIAFGEAVWPSPEIVELPSLLDQPRPRLRAYPRETAVAEKAHALVELGRDNTRLKDYFDIVFLAQNHAFDGTTL